MLNRAYIELRNSSHPGYGECSRCGGNWGWKRGEAHDTSDHGGLFLFCEGCDKIVSLKERWDALDEWKVICIKQIGVYLKDLATEKTLEYTRDILDTDRR